MAAMAAGISASVLIASFQGVWIVRAASFVMQLDTSPPNTMAANHRATTRLLIELILQVRIRRRPTLRHSHCCEISQTGCVPGCPPVVEPVLVCARATPVLVPVQSECPWTTLLTAKPQIFCYLFYHGVHIPVPLSQNIIAAPAGWPGRRRLLEWGGRASA